MRKPVRFESSCRVAASAEALWPLVADTEHGNRAGGLPPVHYLAASRAGGGSTTIGEYRLGPLVLARWTEDPFEWEAPRYYDVERRFHWGPIAAMRGGMELSVTDDGSTIVRVWADLTPGLGPLGWLAIHLIGPLGVKRGAQQVEVFGKYLAGEIDSAFPSLERDDPDGESPERVQKRLLRAPWDKLAQSGVAPELVARLRRHLEHAPDPDVLNMRPLLLAAVWRAERLDVLSLFLHAAEAGMLVMHWDVLCPHCRIAKARYVSLALLQPSAFCASCATAYDAEFDRNVELRFDVAPSLRRAQANAYCEAGPMSTPHRVARRTVAPDSVAALHGELGLGRYRVASRQSAGNVAVDAAPQSASSLTTRVVSVYADRMGPDTLGLPPGPTTLSIVSHLDVPATIDLEVADWPDTIATAALVSTLGIFRDLFSTQVLAAGQQVAIGRLTFFAAGVADATTLYAALGQGRAFKLIEACLRTAASIVGAHHGAVIGTLGERLLATFSSSDDAVGAALTLQRAIAALGGEAGADTERLLQIGVHEGPCLAATVADRLGYFGLAPSVTLSLLDAAGAGDVLVSDEVLADPLVAARLVDEHVDGQLERISLADSLLGVHRLRT
jgi:class 3 adenylate cyclase